MRRARLVVGFAAAVAAIATPRVVRAEDPPAPVPAPAAEYAGKPPAWWVHELADPRTRAVASAALVVIGEPALRDVVVALAAQDAGTRAAAAACVESIPGDPSDRIDVLARALRDPSADVARAAARLAARLGNKAAPLLEALAERAEDPNSPLRRAAIAALVPLAEDSAVAVDALAKRLGDRENDVFGSAVDGLAKAGARSPRAAAALAEGLRTSRGDRARAILRALGRAGGAPEALAALQSARGSGDPILRVGAVGALAAGATSSPSALAAFLECFTDPDREVRMRAIEVAAQSDALAAAAGTAIADAILDADPEVRSKALVSLMQHPGPAAVVVPRLVESAKKVAPGTQTTAVLQRLGPSGVPEVLKAFASADPSLRAVFAAYLVRGEGSRAIADWTQHAATLREPLVHALTDPRTPADLRAPLIDLLGTLARDDPASATAIVDALAATGDLASLPVGLRMQSAVRARLFELIEKPGPERRRALELLAGDSTFPQERIRLRSLLGSDDPIVRRRAALALMRGPSLDEPAGGAALVGPLQEALEDEDAATRRMAARCLHSLAAVAANAVPALRAALADDDRDVVAAAAEAIVNICRVGQLPLEAALSPAVESPDAYLRAGAALAAARGKSRPGETVARIRPLLDAPEPRVRRAALEAVRALGPDAGALVARVGALADDPDPSVVAAARAALEAMQQKPR